MENKLISQYRCRWIELIGLFILVPILLAAPIINEFKFFVVATSFVYVVYQVVVLKLYKGVFKYNKPSRAFLNRIITIGSGILMLGAICVYFYDSSLLFAIVYKKPLLWISILFIYTFLSAIPQEMIYRHFFFDRYKFLFSNEKFFILFNMICFSLCHLFLWNGLVLLLTFAGGGLFAISYFNEKSMMWVCIEHALYGFLIFTLGIGEILAFPS